MPDKRQKLLRIAEIDQSPKQAILNMYEIQEQDVETIMAAIEAVQLEVEDAVANKIDGIDGIDGEDGYTPIKGVDYFDGLDGKDGKDGSDGVDGKDGYTPVKGVDYFDGVDGEKGEQGEKGEKGDMPDHEVDGTMIRFEKPDGTWGEWIKTTKEQFAKVTAGLSLISIKSSGTLVSSQVSEINFVGATVSANGNAVTVTIDPGSSSLEDLTDVNITSKLDGDILQYDSASGQWINLLTATAQAGATVYVDASVTVTGTRNGSERYPYETIQDAIDHFGVPSTQAEYELVKTIIIQDGTNYVENLVFATGLWYVRFEQASLTGTIDWEIDSAERQGSTTAPRLFLLKDEADIAVGITGDIEVYLKSGGSAVSTSYFGVYGMIVNGNITLADGTNIGTSYSSLPIVSFKEATIASAYNFKNRLCFLSLTNATLASSGVSLEMGTLFGARNSTINATSVLEARSSTNSKNIVGLRFNSSGGVTWDSTGSVRNWNADPITADEVNNKITSFPSNTINLNLVGADAIGYDNATSGLTATDVQAAIDELDTNLGDYLPLAGGTMTGVIDMNGFDIDNIKQAINDGASAANPAFLTGDSGWYGTTAKTMHLSISGSDVAWLNINGYDILDANAAFGDIQEQVSGLGVYLDQSNKKAYLGDWRGTTSDTYLETDSSVAFHRFYVNGTQVLDIQANSFEVLVNPHTPDTTVNTSTYSVTGTDNLIRVTYTSTGTCTLTLPTLTAALDGVYIQIKDAGYNAGTNNITINRSGSDTIEGSATSYVMDSDGQKITLYGDFTNTNWEVV